VIKGQVNNKWVNTCKETVVVYFELLSELLSPCTE